MSDDIAAEADRSDRVAKLHNPHLNEVPAEPLPGDEEAALGADESSPLLAQQRHQHVHHSQSQADRLAIVAGFMVLRTVTFVLAAFAAFWLLLLVIDLFVSFPIVETRSSGFVELDLTLVALASVLLSLYGTGSALDYYLGFSSAGLVFLQGLFVLLSSSLRHAHSDGSIVLPFISFGVPFALVLLTTITHKGEIFHSEDRQDLTFKEWVNLSVSVLTRVFLWLVTFFMTISFIFQIYDHISNQPSGTFVSVDDGSFNVHLFCSDRGVSSTEMIAPKRRSNLTIVLEGGETSVEEFASWVLDTPDLDQDIRICYFDRPGITHSDNAPSPMSAGGNADSLSQALATIPGFEQEKLLLLSHGIGGLYSRIFAARHANRVAGIMLVDALHESQFLKDESTWQGFKFFIRGLFSPLGFYHWRRITPFVSSGKHKLSPTPAYFKAKLQEQVTARTLSKNEILTATSLLPSSVPLVVVSSARQIKKVANWSEQQRELTELTDKNLAWEIVEGPHNIWQNKESKGKLQKLLKEILDYAV